ncbi:MAG: hypothetical protein KKE98_00090 [Nanoarchaeota archaeon]|nr:hypothetical protein [Nanoarchaeota archaeon]MBU1596822.1 hypothetical protein [Nanoarchaeota archaeon]
MVSDVAVGQALVVEEADVPVGSQHQCDDEYPPEKFSFFNSHGNNLLFCFTIYPEI